MIKHKAVIFDMDGTILNTIEDLADALNFALKTNKFPKRSLLEVKSFVGNGIRTLIKRSVPDEINDDEVKQLNADFTEYYSVHCADKTKPYEGILELISKLKKEGLKTAVISNKADYAVQILLEQYFNGLFDVSVGERSGVRKKPAPDTVNEVLKTLNCSPDEAIYVGDSEVDIETAKNAGIECIIVGWGFRDKDFLIAHGAKTVVSDPAELHRMLSK